MWKNMWDRLKLINYKYHIVFGFCIRLVVIAYGHYHDLNHAVQFTDVDYNVFTDAARYTWNASSPYNRHTYRYTPLIAILLVPNIILHNCFGKLLFCFVDIIVALLVRSIVIYSFNEFNIYKNKYKAVKSNDPLKKLQVGPGADERTADISMLLWLYNPLTIAIAARGNCDSVSALLVLATLYVLQCKQRPLYAGLLHGLAIHVRLFPIVYSLSFFMFLSSYSFYSLHYQSNGEQQYKKILQRKNNSSNSQLTVMQNNDNCRTIFKMEYVYYLIPNRNQLQLILGCLFSLSSVTIIFYLLYREPFLNESVIYHLVRKDTRHNFSLYFYLQYLSADIIHVGIWQKLLTVFPQFLLLLVFSVRYGLNRLTLNFCILAQTIVMVSFNSVITSQYFVWILSILPLCIWQINMSKKLAIVLLILWASAQGAWLLPAYLLEFQGQNTFMFIWIQSVSFFCANIAILGRLIKYLMLDKWSDKLD